MKIKLTILGSLASLGAAASLSAQSAVTAAVGYHTETIVPGFNVLNSNVGNAVAAAGEFEAAGNDTDVDFTVLLTAGAPYTVQNKTTGESAALTGWTANDLTPVIGSAGDSYEIRQDRTINDLFGAANEAGLNEGAGAPADADIIWLPNQDGSSYTQIFWNNVNDPDNFFEPKTPGWRSTTSALNVDFGDTVVPFDGGMFLQSKGTDPAGFPLVFVGHVRGEDDVDDGHGAQSTSVELEAGFNIVSRIVPVNITLAEANIESMLAPGLKDDADLDILWIPNGDGASYTQIFNNSLNDPDNFFDPSTPGLRSLTAALNVDQSGLNLTSGFLVQRRSSGAGSVDITIPGRLDL